MQLQLININKQFAGSKVLRDCSLNLDRAGLYWLKGDNGCGKSTLLKIITGMIRADSGDILLNQKKLNSEPSWQVIRRGIALMPQEGALLKNKTLVENIQLAEKYLKKADIYEENFLLRMSGSNLDKLSQTDSGFGKPQKVATLSRGESRKLEFYITMMHKADVFLLDEPLAGWDADSKVAAIKILVKLAKDKIVLFTEHSLGEKFQKQLPETFHMENGSIEEYHKDTESIKR